MVILLKVNLERGFHCGSDGKESAWDVGDPSLIPGLGRSPGEGMATNSSILAWRIPGTGAWWAIGHGVAKSDRTEQLTLSLSSLRKVK